MKTELVKILKRHNESLNTFAGRRIYLCFCVNFVPYFADTVKIIVEVYVLCQPDVHCILILVNLYVTSYSLKHGVFP